MEADRRFKGQKREIGLISEKVGVKRKKCIQNKIDIPC